MARNVLDELNSAKLENLRSQIRVLKETSQFYRVKFRSVDPQSIATIDDLASLPYTSNQEIRDAGPFGLLLDGAMPEAYFESSGTTGQPTVGFPDLSHEKAKSFADFLDGWMGLRNERIKRALVSLAYEMNPTGSRFQMALPYAGVTVIPSGVRSTICPPEKILSLITTLKPDALFSRPFEVLRMADGLRQLGVEAGDTSVRKVFVLGEPISKNKWRRMRSAWDDADLYAHYGLTEVDTGLHSCSNGYYHAPASPFSHFSLVDAQLKPVVKDGTRGEIVISVLKKAHAPLVNYRTGDLATKLSGRCACGSDHPRYDIIGRQADGIELGGKTVFPIEVEELVYGVEDVGNEYLFILKDGGELLLLLERAFGSRKTPEEIALDVAERARSGLGIEVGVTVKEYGTIADKLGIAKKKGARFTDLRGLDAETRRDELRVNVVDSDQLRSGSGIPISI
jgi:phenylacetate-CoA ligase